MVKKSDEKPISKTQFIRDRPDATAAEICDEADTLGVVITPAYVSSVRSAEKARAAALEGAETSGPKRKKRTMSTAAGSASSNGHSNGGTSGPMATPEAKTLDDLLDFVLMVQGSAYVLQYVNAKCDPSAFAHLLNR